MPFELSGDFALLEQCDSIYSIIFRLFKGDEMLYRNVLCRMRNMLMFATVYMLLNYPFSDPGSLVQA